MTERVDLDALERVLDAYEDAEEIAALIAELRASRKVVEAADVARHLRRSFSEESAEQERAWRYLDDAFAALEEPVKP